MAEVKETWTWLNVLIVLFATFGSLSYGYCTTIIASTLGQPQFQGYMKLLPGQSNGDNASALIGATNGLFQTGGFFEVPSPSPGFMVIGGAIQAASQNIAMFLVFRMFSGFGVGMAVGAVPLYQSEVSPPHSRGFLVGLHGVAIGAGSALAAWVGYACYTMTGNIQWRLPLALQVVFPAILGLGIYTVPESPRWLLQRDDPDKALAVLMKIHANAQDPDGAFAHREYNIMREQFALETNVIGIAAYKEIFTKAHNLKRLALGFGVMFGGQCTGTLVINYYAVSLYSSIGYTGRQAFLLSAGYVTVSILGNAITAILVDRGGRVNFLIVGFAGLVLVLIGEIAMLSLPAHEQTSGTAAGAIVFLFMHIFFYGSFIDATTYIYVSEIFPTRLRAVGTSLSISGLFLASLIFTQAASSAFKAIHWRYYIVFTVLTAIYVVLLWLFFPETKGLSLEEVAKIFGDPVADGTHVVGKDGHLYGTTSNSNKPEDDVEHEEHSIPNKV
ncbi:hypothetical protein AYL99_01583 [Fonsecaea erecta]|uniref:Major facilitator superfamily (MFS) profile domain-containing protein n=1 Tax=Fonsecaea erecta TaxID=1367422 RepID=A0A179A1X8_9EURO|nr:hypothetical protein AYL99_01583 [Fonsecaea erecta]OAP65611.1 hypothetical protein AYL99_01583 [Fonsecaea erecta]